MNVALDPPPAATTTTWPLSEAQQGLWYAQRLAPDNPVFNCGHALWLEGKLELAAFTDAANRAARECQSLALAMRATTDGAEQWLDEVRYPPLEIIDLAAETDAKAAARAQMQADMARPVDPERDRLARQILFHLRDNRWCWYQRAQHLATDGYGMALWSQRVAELYAEAVAEAPPRQALTPLAEVMAEDAAWRPSDKRARAAAFWRETLTPLPEVAGLATGPAVAAHHCHRLDTALPAELFTQLQQAATAADLGWPDLLTALVALYCQRMAAADGTVVGLPFMGRLGTAAARASALTMNVLPLVVAAQPRQSLADFVEAMARAQLRARRHGRYRSEQIRRDLGLLGGQRRLYAALINVQPFYRPLELPGVATRLEILGTGPVDDLTIGFRGQGAAMRLELEANPELYTRSDAEAHLERLPHFLTAALQALAADGCVADVPLANPAEAARHLGSLNNSAHALPDTTLTALLEKQMAATPDATALVFGKESLSYAELEQRTRALALALRQRGVGPESLVAIALPRSLELLVGMLAVLRAGGANLPLDLDHPPERIARVLALAKPVCALVRAEDAAALPEDLPQLTPDQWPAPTDAALAAVSRPEHATYVIYTSGSTGEPKGVVIEHRAIVNRLEWMRQHYGFTAADRILQKTPISFDVSVWELFLPLISGATEVIAAPSAHRDPAELARIIRQQAVSTCHFVPSMLEAFLDHPDSRGLELARVFVSGEALSASLRQRFHARIQAELHNLYGPTEAAVDVSFWPAGPDDDSDPVPIGFPVWNTQLYVLDDKLRPQPPGVPGDLYLGGVQLARGYLGRDDLTAAAFLPDPRCPGQRLYKTGDVAAWRAGDGACLYLGRSDHQVKLRGLRIELGEIEAALRDSGLIQRAEVMLRDEGGTSRLVAWVESNSLGPDAELTEALRSHLARRLPDYMVPAAIVPVTEWPLTHNGKLDRKALPAPHFGITNNGPALASATEKALAELVIEQLHLPADTRLTANADFFALGGDSLTAVQLLLKIENRWHRDPGLGTLFENPTLGALATAIDNEQVHFDDGLKPLLQLAAGNDDAAPLFLVHPAGGIAWGYRGLAQAIAGSTCGRSVWGLQSPGLEPGHPLPPDIDTLAEAYASRVAALQADGPIHLGGWSVGGIIAQAMAVALQARGREVGLVALLDAYPAECWRDEPKPTPQEALRALLAIAGEDPQAHPELDTRAKLVAFLRAGDTALGNLPEAALEGVVRVVTDTNRLIRAHHHRRMRGRLLHLRAAHDHAGEPQLDPRRWEAWADTVERIDLPFVHGEMTGPEATARIAPLLCARMEALP